jgi:hypothetical protein
MHVPRPVEIRRLKRAYQHDAIKPYHPIPAIMQVNYNIRQELQKWHPPPFRYLSGLELTMGDESEITQADRYETMHFDPEVDTLVVHQSLLGTFLWNWKHTVIKRLAVLCYGPPSLEIISKLIFKEGLESVIFAEEMIWDFRANRGVAGFLPCRKKSRIVGLWRRMARGTLKGFKGDWKVGQPLECKEMVLVRERPKLEMNHRTPRED